MFSYGRVPHGLEKDLKSNFTALIELAGPRANHEVYLNSIEMGKGIYGAEAGRTIINSHEGSQA